MAFHAVRERLAESAWAVWSQFVPHGTDGWSFVVGLGWGIVIALGVALVVGMHLDTQSAEGCMQIGGWNNCFIYML